MFTLYCIVNIPPNGIEIDERHSLMIPKELCRSGSNTKPPGEGLEGWLKQAAALPTLLV